jgi:D-lactate dehydrogenase
LTGTEVKNKTLLVVGVGHIGHEVARIGKGLGMTVLGVDPARKHDDIDYVTFEEALPDADVIVAAMNLTAENRGFFNRARLAPAKPGAVFVNIARGELSPGTELLKLLEDGLLAGVALDVYEEESALAVALRSGRATTNPEALAVLAMKDRPDVLCTPHNAFNTKESLRQKAEQTVAQVRHYFTKGRFVWDVPD